MPDRFKNLKRGRKTSRRTKKSHSSNPLVVPRRSLRSVTRVFNGTRMEGLNSEQTALLLSMAHCTGWSADRIRLKIKEVIRLNVKAEDVWSFHSGWVMDRGKKQTVRPGEIEVMLWALSRVGITLEKIGKPLHLTQPPISVEFTPKWTLKKYNGRPICKGFDQVTRDQAKAYLHTQSIEAFGKLSPSEEPVAQLFGDIIEKLIKDILKSWGVALKAKVEADSPSYKALKDAEYVQLIMDYLQVYHNSYEATYGLMEDTRRGGQLGHIQDNTVYIRSTGYGVKVIIGLMMADRLHVIEKVRREERERIAYQMIPDFELPADSKNCPICQDHLGTATPEGTTEQALKLIICCGQIIGGSCLKSWLARPGPGYKKNCPTCRFPFPPSFLEKLFDGEVLTSEDEEDEDDAESSIVVDDRNLRMAYSPTPSYDSDIEWELERERERERLGLPEPVSDAEGEPRPWLHDFPGFDEARAWASPAEVVSAAAVGVRPLGNLVGVGLVNPEHAPIPQRLDALPDVAAAASIGGAGAERNDDFMMEG